MTLAVSLASRAAGLPLAAPAIDALLTAHGSTVMTAGAWHGDFVPWNVRSGGGEIGVWDWERFATGVPLGFDRLHFDAQVAVHRRGMAIPAALASLTANSSQLLPGLDDGARSATVAAYLTELLVRYESDSIGTDNPALTAWCTHLADALTRPEVLQ